MNEEPGRPKYRADIDGLRGVAVLAVVAFHAFPEKAHAGFIGVDVFFVISGYLIATIILGGLRSGRFTFREFYARRIRRIFPALILVLAAAGVAGWFLYAAHEYKGLGRHILGGATFSSNFLLWQESGYFDIDAERKALLHLWSLAIEEQFYLFFPLILWAAHKRRWRPLAVTGAIGIASFGWNIFTHAAHPTADFYSPLTRAWELMLGAILASAVLDPPARLRAWITKADRWLVRGGRSIDGWPEENALGQIASVAGMYLLIAAGGLISKSDPFPGWYALLPTLGAALLIGGGASAGVNRRILSFRPLVWFGLISFPLYLWHWPLLSISRVAAGEPLSSTYKLAMIAAAIALSWLTYRFVERPLRAAAGHGAKISELAFTLASLGVIGFSIWWSGGFTFRPVARTYEGYLKSVKFGDGDCAPLDAPAKFCRIGDPDAPTLAFLAGDSHAGVMRPAFAKYAREKGVSFVYMNISPPLLGIACGTAEGSPEDICIEANRQIFDYVKSHGIRDVILIARWTNYDNRRIRIVSAAGAETTAGPTHAIREGVIHTIEAYRAIGVDVHVVIDNPLQRILPEDIIRRSEKLDDESINHNAVLTIERDQNQAWMSDLLKDSAGTEAEVWDFTDVYCPKDICPLVKGGKFLYADLDHLSVDGSMLVYPELKKALETL